MCRRIIEAPFMPSRVIGCMPVLTREGREVAFWIGGGNDYLGRAHCRRGQSADARNSAGERGLETVAKTVYQHGAVISKGLERADTAEKPAATASSYCC